MAETNALLSSIKVGWKKVVESSEGQKTHYMCLMRKLSLWDLFTSSLWKAFQKSQICGGLCSYLWPFYMTLFLAGKKEANCFHSVWCFLAVHIFFIIIVTWKFLEIQNTHGKISCLETMEGVPIVHISRESLGQMLTMILFNLLHHSQSVQRRLAYQSCITKAWSETSAGV